MFTFRRLAIPLGIAVLACSGVGSAQLPSTNPFAAPSPLLYQAPDFTRIRNTDFQPAIDEGMRQQLAEVGAVIRNPAAPTFENTILPLERAGQLLSRVQRVFGALTSSNTNDTLQAIQRALAPRLAAHRDAISLNDTLFLRIRSLSDRRASLGLDSLQRLVVERYYRDFVRAGALLSEADKTKLRALNREQASLTNEFGRRLMAATRAGGVVVDDASQLAGLSAGEIAAAAGAAQARGLAGRWLLPLQNTTQQPAQSSLQNRALRQRLFEASTTRAARGDSNDTRQVILRLAELRPDRAKLLGYPSLAAYGLDETMAKTPANALRLLTQLAAPATVKARGEAAAMQQLANKQGGTFQLQPWDWQFYAEQVRVAQYALDEEQIKPYFEMDRVLRDGVFYAAQQLYGLTFKERKDIPVYHPDVRVFEVFDADSSLGLFYADYYKRDNKNGGAWSSGFVSRSALHGTRPVVTNNCNFTKPAAGQPALLTWDNVTTMYHEFGHALSSFLNAAPYPRLAGNMPRDFTEVPSQFMEHWALHPEVFAHYARHYQTGAPMPAALEAKIRRTTTFDQGFATTEYLGAALLDMAWHTLTVNDHPTDVDAFEAQALKRFGVDLPLVPPRYKTNYFSHIWSGGYSAGYYAYIWAEVIDADAYSWFEENGGLTRANGQRFRDMILSRGGTGDMATMYRAFRGRDPEIASLLKNRGLTGGTP
ncbi:MAG: M3 family metallopeptidase [Gemmatimonadaceae bacterium]|nr:M3 family metallopeptidase [Gemmatimonadaceae bacterium]